MLQTNDIGVLFATLRSGYGSRWTQGANDIPHWQKVLDGWSVQEIMSAADTATKHYPDFPPTSGQFVVLLKAGKMRHTMALPAPLFDMDNAERAVRDMRKLVGDERYEAAKKRANS